MLSEYVWKRENVELQNTTKVIQVSPKLVTDRAVYSCAAKNTVGRSEFSQSVPMVVEGRLIFSLKFQCCLLFHYIILPATYTDNLLKESGKPVNRNCFQIILNLEKYGRVIGI